MNRQQIVNRLILLSAALNKESFNGPLEQAQNAQIVNGILESEVFGEEVALLEKEHVIFYGEQGYVPTRKGWDILRPQIQTKVVKPIEKMTNVEVLSTFVESGFAICHRLPSDKLMQKKARESYGDVADVLTCVAESYNNVFAPVEPTSDVEYDGCTNYTVGETEVAVEA